MTYCILVTYNPNIFQLNKTIESLENQVEKIVIVKNSNEHLDIDKKAIYIIQLDKNYGIAYAQNKGIEYAISENADFVLLSDQDSIYPKYFVKNAINCFKRHKNELIAAVTPYFFNENKKQFSRISITKTKTIVPEKNKDYEIQHAISSGSLIPSSVFNDIGLMNERLFIDFVDNEWCWRATSKKYKIICDTSNILNHNMGDSYKTILNHKFVAYSDFRNYYFFRNATYLLYHSRYFNIKDWLVFWFFIKTKTLVFYITNGFNLIHIKLIFKAKYRGITNTFTIDKK